MALFEISEGAMLILVWFALMAAGVIVSLPYRKFEKDN